ncbi:hypothetical protein RchiOBHm_Chr2g0130761 [Rosa chinensis]|uniref:Uncharacterized protein n=1 Tax=Rosa chinensis TaxID=74649 RepID=A0A2P6RUW6_ROSCH|nr:hypothetical protein RchiOBHm_Chr2g0130761 [Rosa chinensis]
MRKRGLKLKIFTLRKKIAPDPKTETQTLSSLSTSILNPDSSSSSSSSPSQSSLLHSQEESEAPRSRPRSKIEVTALNPEPGLDLRLAELKKLKRNGSFLSSPTEVGVGALNSNTATQLHSTAPFLTLSVTPCLRLRHF